MANFGFPIVVSAYLLFRVESKLEKLTEVIVDLNKIVENLKPVSRMNEKKLKKKAERKRAMPERGRPLNLWN